MPRVYRVKKARKDQGTCGHCGCALKAGDPYTYWEFRISMGKSFGTRRMVRCAQPACQPKPKDLTQSEFWIAVYDLQETVFQGETVEDLESQVEEVKTQIEDIRDELQGKLDNMPEGLQQGSTGELLQERIEAMEELINGLDAVDLTFDEPEREKDVTDEVHERAVEKAQEERVSELTDELSNILGDVSCS